MKFKFSSQLYCRVKEYIKNVGNKMIVNPNLDENFHQVLSIILSNGWQRRFKECHHSLESRLMNKFWEVSSTEKHPNQTNLN